LWQAGDDGMGDFWQNKGNDFILALIMLILGVILAKPLEALLKWLWKKLQAGFQSLGIGFQKRYCEALIKEHHRLRLIGAYSRDVQPPRLKEIYISLRMNTSGKNDDKENPAVAWERIFDSKDKSIAILGQPGAGKSTLLDYLVFRTYAKRLTE
jgi:hypothetical protein